MPRLAFRLESRMLGLVGSRIFAAFLKEFKEAKLRFKFWNDSAWRFMGVLGGYKPLTWVISAVTPLICLLFTTPEPPSRNLLLRQCLSSPFRFLRKGDFKV